MIPYGRQNISQQDIDAVTAVLNSDFITQGPKVVQFEQAMAQYCDTQFACAVNSATSALHIACLALGLEKDDLVWTSPNSFVASSNCALYCQAKVDFVDIDPTTGNLCVKALQHKLETSKTIPKIVIPVHFAGQSCDMASIHKLSQKYGFKIIEDASHAVGGKYQNRPVGCCQYSDITIFSFHPVKIITSAEGGMAVTNDQNVAEKLELYRSHGVTRNPSLMTTHNDEPWYYQQVELGFNYRMTELQAALGLSQLSRLDEFVSRRNDLAQEYRLKLAHLPLEILDVEKKCYSSYHLFVIKVEQSKRKQLFNFLRENNIGVNVHYIPIHTQPYYKELGFNDGDFPNAERYYQQCISLPLFADLESSQIDYIIAKLTEFLCK